MVAQLETPSSSLLQVRNVSRHFGGLAAVSDFSLELRGGELIGLIGPNGAGKTTCFNLITGVYAPSSGQIDAIGMRIDGLSPMEINRAGIARTFQNIRLFANLTVLENVTVGLNRPAEMGLFRTILRLPGFLRERDRAEADGMELLATLDLADKANQLARNLPYGDQRCLEIARALATGPKVLLLDEPAAGMNPNEKAELMELIRFIRDRFKVGILLIEHDMKLVMSICERITVLDHGETIAVGTPDEVRTNPKVIEAYLGEQDAQAKTAAMMAAEPSLPGDSVKPLGVANMRTGALGPPTKEGSANEKRKFRPAAPITAGVLFALICGPCSAFITNPDVTNPRMSTVMLIAIGIGAAILSIARSALSYLFASVLFLAILGGGIAALSSGRSNNDADIAFAGLALIGLVFTGFAIYCLRERE